MLCWVAIVLGAGPSGTLVDRIVAVVDQDVITHSELLQEARVALVMRESPAAAQAELPPELLTSFLDYLVSQHIIAAHACRVGGVDVSEEEVSVEVERFAQLFPSRAAYQAFLRRFAIAEAMLASILRRDLRNSRYVAERLRSSKPEEGAAGSESARQQEAISAWLRELRGGVELRILGAQGELELQ